MTMKRDVIIYMRQDSSLLHSINTQADHSQSDHYINFQKINHKYTKSRTHSIHKQQGCGPIPLMQMEVASIHLIQCDSGCIF